MNKNESEDICKYFLERMRYEEEIKKDLHTLARNEILISPKITLFGPGAMSLDNIRWLMNLSAWEDTVFICVSEIRFSLVKALAWYQMAEKYSRNDWFLFVRYYFDNAIYRLFGCHDKVAHLFYYLYKLDVESGSSKKTDKMRLYPNVVKKAIERIDKESLYIHFLDEIEKIIKPYKEFRRAKTHREEPGIRVSDDFIGSTWATQKTSEDRKIIWVGTRISTNAAELKDSLPSSYNKLILTLKEVFTKIKEKVEYEIRKDV